MALVAATQGGAVLFRPECLPWSDHRQQQRPQQLLLHGAQYRERRQLFLRSYHFSRKQSPRERVGRTFVTSLRLVRVRLRDARRLPRLLWTRLRSLLSGHRRHRRRYFRRVMVSQPALASVIGSAGNIL